MRTGIDSDAIGLGLRSPHLPHVMASRPSIDFFEIHSENYFDGVMGRELELIRSNYPVTLHGVGLSLGSAEGLDEEHMRRLVTLSTQVVPALISDHLSWSVNEGRYLNDLLPLPYTEEALKVVCANVNRAQELLRRSMLIENPSAYLRFVHSTIPEAEFLNEVALRTGCAILCDLNNIYVSAQNLRQDPHVFLDGINPRIVAELHLSGHFETDRNGHRLLVDDHGTRVATPVWHLYRDAIDRFGDVPTLIEWDRNLPGFEMLMAEAHLAGECHNESLARSPGERNAPAA